MKHSLAFDQWKRKRSIYPCSIQIDSRISPSPDLINYLYSKQLYSFHDGDIRPHLQLANLAVLSEFGLRSGTFRDIYELIASTCMGLRKLVLYGSMTQYEGFFVDVAAFCRSCPTVSHLAIGLSIHYGFGTGLFKEDLGTQVRHLVLDRPFTRHIAIHRTQYSPNSPLQLVEVPLWLHGLGRRAYFGPYDRGVHTMEVITSKHLNHIF